MIYGTWFTFFSRGTVIKAKVSEAWRYLGVIRNRESKKYSTMATLNRTKEQTMIYRISGLDFC